MDFCRQFIVVILVLCVVGDIGHFLNSIWTGTCSNNHGPVSQNSGLLIPAADAWVSIAAKAASKAAKHFSKKAAKKGKKVGGSEHTKNKRPSTKGKHQKGQARKQKDQARSEGKKQKGAPDGSKKRRKR